VVVSDSMFMDIAGTWRPKEVNAQSPARGKAIIYAVEGQHGKSLPRLIQSARE
jgi:hypothetical protein